MPSASMRRAVNSSASRVAVVEPVRVVDDREHRLVLGGGAEHAEHRGGHGEPVVRRGLLDRHRAAQRARLGLGDAVEQVEQRREEVEQPRERDVGLGLVAAGAHDAEVRRAEAAASASSVLLPMPASPCTTSAARAAFPGRFEHALRARSSPGSVRARAREA